MNMCYDVLLCNWQLITTSKAYITVVMNRLAHVAFHKVYGVNTHQER